jgi:hypothetical protein
VKNWWRKWSYEIPLAFGDALWDVLVVQFADFLSRLTARRVLEFIAIAILVMAFIQTVPIELALLFAGDTLTYLEFVVIVRLAAGKEHFWHALHLAARLARIAMHAARTATDRTVAGINRPRERRTPARPATPRRSESSDDSAGFGAAWGVLAAA